MKPTIIERNSDRVFIIMPKDFLGMLLISHPAKLKANRLKTQSISLLW